MITNQILNPEQVEQKIRRMAFQIYENNFEENEIILAGISGGGYILAEKLKAILEELTEITPILFKLNIDKNQPAQSEINFEGNIQDLNRKVVILVDDVLNTGRTLIYSLSSFLKISLKKLEVLVLIDRNHRKFPISANYIGYSLSTTLQEHIQVILTDKKKAGVYLS